MKRKAITQREARALRKRVQQLEGMIERERSAWASEFPGGTHLGRISWDGADHRASAAYTARRLGHAVVVVASSARQLELYALPHPKVPV
jgi:hypothetical protein